MSERNSFEINVVGSKNSGKNNLFKFLLPVKSLPKKESSSVIKIVQKECSNGEEAAYIDRERNLLELQSGQMDFCLSDVLEVSDINYNLDRKQLTDLVRNENSMIIYVLDAKQLGTAKDKENKKLLEELFKVMELEGKLVSDQCIFVLNNCAYTVTEGMEQLINKVRRYLVQFDIIDPTLIPVDEYTADLIMRKRMRRIIFWREWIYLKLYKSVMIYNDELHYDGYAVVPLGGVRKYICGELRKCRESDDWESEALIHTGVPVLEAVIREKMQ
ncbi:MAG: hypothetical protein R3Y54_09015 [Eubacteriales bacterium]